MYFDYHIHTPFSDGRSTHEEYIASAETKKMSEIGFSDHVTLKEDVKWATKISDYHKVVEKIAELKTTSKKVEVKYGVEMDFFPYMHHKLSKFINSYPFDYVIGSVHFLDDWEINSTQTDFKRFGINQLYTKYFKMIQEAAKSKLFDIVGHADIIKMFGIKPSIKLDTILETTVKIFKDNNLAVELNTNGKNRPCKEFYPSNDFLLMCYAYQIPVLITSDSHHVSRLCENFAEATTLLNRIGYQRLVSFSDRKRVFKDI